MRIGILQTAGEAGAVEPNLAMLAEKAAEARRHGVRLLVCPELFLTGYNVDTPAMTRLAEAAEGPSAKRIANIARTNRIAILYG